MRLGYCGGDSRRSDESDFEGETPGEIVDTVLSIEGLDPAAADSNQRAQIRAVVVDWLFDPHGQGGRSGLPH